MLLHAKDCAQKIYRTADTDVVLLAISTVDSIQAEKLCIAFGPGNRFRYIEAKN